MSQYIENCAGVILAGGENKRMPVIKSFIEIEGEMIIHKQLTLMQALFCETMIITNDPGHYIHFKVPLIGDVFSLKGPLTGIVTALINSKTEWVFIIACDMPFINEKIIRHMASQRDGYECVVPFHDSHAEPLLAFYSKKTADAMEKALKRRERKIQTFLAYQRVKYIDESTIRSLCPYDRIFINLNTPDDLTFLKKEKADEIKGQESN